MHKSQHPLPGANDYQRIRKAILFISQQASSQPSLDQIAHHVGLDASHFHKLFVRWAGLTPKSFLQSLTLDHAKHLLTRNTPLLETALATGLSGPGRLHDLFVQYEALSPGEYARKGEGLTIKYGFHDCPFGLALLMKTKRGIAGLAFADDDKERQSVLEDMMNRWPHATYYEDENATRPEAAHIFSPAKWQPEQPLRLVLIGSDFELSVWQSLLNIPHGHSVTYGALAQSIDKPRAHRAVASAVGRNPISFVVPCHRVLRKGGGLGGYHWSLPRKQAIIGWEKGLREKQKKTGPGRSVD